MKVAVIKYNAGNIFSVECALRRIGVEPIVTDDPVLINSADKVIFPGVGEASSAMVYLRERGLDKVIAGLKQPLLGICIGLQLLCRHSEEGNTDCIGIFNTDVKKFDAEDSGMKIPHMGWNTVESTVESNPLIPDDGRYVYYVHGYYAPVCRETIAITDYINPFSAMMRKDNFFATQFHPEKSGDVGESILKNFMSL